MLGGGVATWSFPQGEGGAFLLVKVYRFMCLFLFYNFWRTYVIFIWPLTPLFWTSGDVCPRFQRLCGSLVCFLACVLLRFTSGATLADCIEVNMATEPFRYYSSVSWDRFVNRRTENWKCYFSWTTHVIGKNCRWWESPPILTNYTECKQRKLNIDHPGRTQNSYLWGFHRDVLNVSAQQPLLKWVTPRIEFHEQWGSSVLSLAAHRYSDQNQR